MPTQSVGTPFTDRAAKPHNASTLALRAENVIDFPLKPYGGLVHLRDILLDAFLDLVVEEDEFLLVIDAGAQPRLWIDNCAWIDACSDDTAFRFTLNTRGGRQTLLETHSLSMLAEISVLYLGTKIDRSPELERFL